MIHTTRIRFVVRIGLLSLLIPLLSGVAKIDKFQAEVFDLKRYSFSLHWKKADGTAYTSLAAVKKALEEEGKSVVALANAGIYGKDYAPLGLHIENGKVLRPLNRAKGGGNFFLKPNGVFLIDTTGARILRADRVRSLKGVTLATQSGPLLFDKQGIHPRFLKNSKSKYIRNAVGVRRDGSVVMAISRVPVTFWELATYLRDEMKCEAGLYLDGSISVMWREGKGASQQFLPFVGILAVTRKNTD